MGKLIVFPFSEKNGRRRIRNKKKKESAMSGLKQLKEFIEFQEWYAQKNKKEEKKEEKKENFWTQKYTAWQMLVFSFGASIPQAIIAVYLINILRRQLGLP